MFEDALLMSSLGKALHALLRPLVRLMLRHSVPYSAFDAIAKKVYVEVAMEDFALPGKKPSVSRASILTGLTRKEVTALLAVPSGDVDAATTHYNRAARVLTAWVREPAFSDGSGSPKELPIEGAEGFAELVRLHAGDVPWRAVLDELERVGSVEMGPKGSVRLIQRAFVPSASLHSKLAILGSDVGELIETIAFNLDPGSEPARFQRKVMYTGIPQRNVVAFRKWSADESQALLEKFDKWLSEHDLGELPEADWPEHSPAKVGVGVYYYEEASRPHGVPL